MLQELGLISQLHHIVDSSFLKAIEEGELIVIFGCYYSANWFGLGRCSVWR